VWTIDDAHAPLYWFPRECPRVTVWANDDEQGRRLATQFESRSSRVQVALASWEPRIRATRLYEYRFAPGPFEPWPDADGQWVSHEAVVPIDVVPIGDLIERQRVAGVDLRLVDDLGPIRDLVLTSGLPFSIVRWANLDLSP